MNKKPLIILTGPTAVGKTALSIRLAQKIGGEIISADSMQVYKQMNIGSAKILPEEMQNIRHHMIDILEPEEPFHVMLFQTLVKQCLSEIYERGHIPIITGGTGFYIQAILYDISFTQEQGNAEYRLFLEQQAKEKGEDFLHGLLQEVDEEAANQIHAHNQKRVIRALEFHKMTGQKISSHNEAERQKEYAYNACYFVLSDNRQRLYEAIEKRVDQMLKKGLVEEVKKLRKRGLNKEMVSMQGLGYKEIFSYLEGEISLERAVYLIKRDTRHFAKRQLTWFRREKDVIWVEKEAFSYDEECMLCFLMRSLEEKGIRKDKKND